MTLRGAHGFTLIEMVVAVALMSLAGLAMFESLRFAQRTYEKIDMREAALAELTSSQRVLRALIESSYPYTNEQRLINAPRNMLGAKNEIAFSAPALQGSGGAGFDRYSIVLRLNPKTSTYDVIARWWVDRNGLPPPTDAAIVEETLISNVASLAFAYLMPTNSGPTFGASDLARHQTWLDEWREHDRLPTAVRVRIKYASKDSRGVLNVWPDLVVAPRITDDANCEFDVVAQGCRPGV